MAEWLKSLPSGGPRCFITQNVECHDTTNNLVWSAVSSGGYTWGQAVWDSALAGNNAPDINDGSWVNDYDPAYLPGAGGLDNALVDYCHDLVEGRYSDWRLPRWDEVVTAGAEGAAGTYFASSHANVNFWLSSNLDAGRARIGLFNSSSYTISISWKVDPFKVICVRDL